MDDGRIKLFFSLIINILTETLIILIQKQIEDYLTLFVKCKTA